MGAGVQGPRRRNGLRAFRAVEREIRTDLAAGWTLVAIYEALREKLGMSYPQFTRYVRRLRREGAATSTHSGQAEQQARPGTVRTERSEPFRGRPEDSMPTLDMDGFAADALKKKDLL